MKKILIPIDFSRSSNNALSYAVALSRHYPVNQIILVVNVYTTEFEQLIPTADFVQYSIDKVAEQDNQLHAQFEELKHTILHRLKSGVRVSFILSKIPFLQTLRSLLKQQQPDLMLIGSNHGISGEESYIGNHLIKIAKTSTMPVLIVPELTRYQQIKRALIPFNLSNMPGIKLIKRLDNADEWPHPDLLLLNVNDSSDSLDTRLTRNPKLEIMQSLQHYHYQVYYTSENDILKSINRFSLEQDLQLIIALPGKHSFLYNLTHRSIIKALAKNNYKPVLILK